MSALPGRPARVERRNQPAGAAVPPAGVAEGLRAVRARRGFFQRRRAALHFQQRAGGAGTRREGIEDLSGRREAEKVGTVAQTAATTAEPATAVAKRPAEKIGRAEETGSAKAGFTTTKARRAKTAGAKARFRRQAERRKAESAARSARQAGRDDAGRGQASARRAKR